MNAGIFDDKPEVGCLPAASDERDGSSDEMRLESLGPLEREGGSCYFTSELNSRP
jgi:hypothetical protein